MNHTEQARQVYQKLEMLNRQRSIRQDGVPVIHYKDDVTALIAQALTAAVAAERARCIEVVQDHSCRTYKECCDCQGAIVKELRTGEATG